MLSKVSDSYLSILGYMITNFYYKDNKSTLEEDAMKQFEENEFTKGFIPCIQKCVDIFGLFCMCSKYVYYQYEKSQKSITQIIRCMNLCLSNMNHFNGIVAGITRNSAIPLVCNFLTNIILKPKIQNAQPSTFFGSQSTTDDSQSNGKKFNSKSEDRIKEEENLFILALNSYGYILDIHPDAITSSHVNRLLLKFKSKNISTREYTTICQFLINCYNCRVRSKQVENSKILDTLLNLKQFRQQDFANQSFYSGQMRNNQQLSWCWTLQLITCALNNIEESYVRQKFMTNLLTKYQGRFLSILSFKFKSYTPGAETEDQYLNE